MRGKRHGVGVAVRHLTLGFAMMGMLAGGCGPDTGASRELRFEVLVESDPGDPLAGVVVEIDGEDIGVTGSSGHVRTTRSVHPGQLVALTYACPQGHVPETSPRLFRTRRYVRGKSKGQVSLRLRCRPHKRLAVFVVRARGAGIVDVLIDGEAAASTDSFGVAHLSRRATPGTEFLVELTPRNAQFRPTMTSRVFGLADSDEIFVFDQPYRKGSVSRRVHRATPRIVRIE